MAKGYWIARVDVHNDEGYKAYRGGQPGRSSRNSAAASSCAAARFTAIEGQSRSRNVVIEFPDYETALACYHSPEYQDNIKVRLPHSVADLIIIEGYDGPQP